MDQLIDNIEIKIKIIKNSMIQMTQKNIKILKIKTKIGKTYEEKPDEEESSVEHVMDDQR